MRTSVTIATKNVAVWSGNDIAYVTLDFELNVDLEVKVTRRVILQHATNKVRI